MNARSQAALLGVAHPTRQKLLKQASKFMAKNGVLPSVSDVASAAKVTRQTAYRHFGTADALAAAATTECMRPEITALVEAVSLLRDPIERLDVTARKMVALTFKHERVLRAMIRFSVCNPNRPRGKDRLQWFRTALDPLREHLDETGFNRLITAIVLAVSFEGVITLMDVCGPNEGAASDVAGWVAQALVRQAISEAPRRPKART